MLASVRSGAIVGLDGAIVEVEVDISSGLPAFMIVGLPDTAVQEARERVRAAIRNSGGTFPMKRIVVNLAPADLKKAGPSYDLPIAVGILLSSGQLQAEITNILFLGELSLDGSLRHTNGILPMVALAHQNGISSIIVPDVDAGEASLVDSAIIMPFNTLVQLVSYLRGEMAAPEYKQDKVEAAVTNGVTTKKYHIDRQGRIEQIKFVEQNVRLYATDAKDAKNISRLSGSSLEYKAKKTFPNACGYGITKAHIRLTWKNLPFDRFCFEDNRQRPTKQISDNNEYEVVFEFTKANIPST